MSSARLHQRDDSGGEERSSIDKMSSSVGERISRRVRNTPTCSSLSQTQLIRAKMSVGFLPAGLDAWSCRAAA